MQRLAYSFFNQKRERMAEEVISRSISIKVCGLAKFLAWTILLEVTRGIFYQIILKWVQWSLTRNLLKFCSAVALSASFFPAFGVLRLPRLGMRELILVLFISSFGLCLFGFVGFLFLLGSGKGCGLWLWHSLDFSLTCFWTEDVR